MNYRHAYHAGNMADCHKHAVLVWLLRALARKDKPFCMLDTHAGIGRYDLSANPALRTGEASRGILRLLHDTPAPLADYVGLVRALGLYPGSPALGAALLRPTDRLVACELHPDDHAALRGAMRGDPRVAVHLRDGYAAVGAFLPPPERRGLTLIDPPYEAANEQDRLQAALRTAHARFPGGTIAAWYPIKHRAPVRALHDTLTASGITDIVATELFVRAPLDAARLNGSGLLVINPPYRFEDEVPAILDALLARLGDREAGEGTALIRIAAERGGRATAAESGRKKAAPPGTDDDAPEHRIDGASAQHGGEAMGRGIKGRAVPRGGGFDTTGRDTRANTFEPDGNAATAERGTDGHAAARGGVCDTTERRTHAGASEHDGNTAIAERNINGRAAARGGVCDTTDGGTRAPVSEHDGNAATAERDHASERGGNGTTERGRGGSSAAPGDTSGTTERGTGDAMSEFDNAGMAGRGSDGTMANRGAKHAADEPET